MAGKPAEYFDVHAHNEAYWRRRLAIADDAAYVGKALSAGRTPNGVFGLKLHWHQGRSLVAKLLAESGTVAPDGDAVMRQLDGLLRARLGETRYVWLRRRNTVAQAISYYRASRSDRWRVSADEPEPAASAPAPVVPFDYTAIDEFVGMIERFDRCWFQFFKTQQLRALVVIYEDFIAAQAATLRKVLDFLGLSHTVPDAIPAMYRRQADERSAEWETRYRTLKAQRIAGTRFTATKSRPRRTRPTLPDAPSAPGLGAPAAPLSKLPALKLIAYDLHSGLDQALDTAPPTRAWMDATGRFAYRCLPLVIANQNGWMIRNRQRLTAVWDGNPRPAGVSVTFDEPSNQPYASGHFGFGVLTFSIGYLFRTPPGYNIHVRGPANAPKDGIGALEGIIETDWTPTTFTMNWKFTRPGHPVVFEAGEPIAMISPLPRGDVERFQPEIRPIAADPDWQAGYQDWSRMRDAFNKAQSAGDQEAVAAGWQRHYMLGVTTDALEAPEHQTGLSLRPFRDARGEKEGG